MTSLSPSPRRPQLPHVTTFPQVGGGTSEQEPLQLVGDDAHERAIVEAGKALEAAQARYEQTGDSGDAAARDMAKNEFYRLLKLRSPQMVARLQAALDERISRA